MYTINKQQWSRDRVSWKREQEHSTSRTIVRLFEYIIGHYNPSVRIIDLVSHTTYVVCVNFIHKWRDLQFKIDYERQSFWKTFHGNFICSQSFCPKSAERKSLKKYLTKFVLMSGLLFEAYLLDHGDFKLTVCWEL